MNAPERLPRPMGLVLNMPFDEYLAIDALSASGLKHFARSPWHLKNRVKVEQTRPMLRGSLAHCAQLEPDAMAARYIVTPENAPRRPTAAQWNAKKPGPDSVAAMDWWRDFTARCEGRQIVTHDEYSITQAQLRAVQAEPYLAALFSRGYGESSIFWVDKASGVYCKARPDWIQPLDGGSVRMAELKTTIDESPEGFSRTMARLGYHRARAHYISGFEQATGQKVAEYVFAAVTSAPPVLAVPYWLDEETVTQAADEYAEHMDRFAWCLREDKWPAYGDGPQLISLPAWAKRSSELEVSYVD